MKHSGISTSFSSVFVTSFNQLDRYLVVVRWWDGAHALTDSLCVRVSLLISLNVSHRIHPDPEASLKKLIRRHFFPHLKVATKKKKTQNNRKASGLFLISSSLVLWARLRERTEMIRETPVLHKKPLVSFTWLLWNNTDRRLFSSLSRECLRFFAPCCATSDCEWTKSRNSNR